MIKPNKLILLAVFCLVVNVTIVYSVAEIDYDDNYTTGASTSDDGICWGNSALDVGLDGEQADTMVICYDWCNGGNIYDDCEYETVDDFNACKSESSWLTNFCSGTPSNCSQTADLTNSEHVIDTGSVGDRWRCNIGIKYYRDCGGPTYDVGTPSAQYYYVVSPRQYACITEGDDYEDLGWYSAGSTVTLDSSISCTYSWQGCDEDEDDSNSDFGTYGTTVPDSPCKINDGSTINNVCTVNDDCTFEYCSGGAATQYKYLCQSDGSDAYDYQYKTFEDTCGGTGYESSWTGETTYYCTTESGSGYVCDDAHDESITTTPPPSSPCRKDIGQSCGSTPDCWNDDGGNWCNSISKCTDGANGRACGSDSDCDTYCLGGICGATCYYDSECGENKYCVCGSCKTTNDYTTNDSCCNSALGETCSNSPADCGICQPKIVVPSKLVFEVN